MCVNLVLRSDTIRMYRSLEEEEEGRISDHMPHQRTYSTDLICRYSNKKSMAFKFVFLSSTQSKQSVHFDFKTSTYTSVQVTHPTHAIGL